MHEWSPCVTDCALVTGNPTHLDSWLGILAIASDRTASRLGDLRGLGDIDTAEYGRQAVALGSALRSRLVQWVREEVDRDLETIAAIEARGLKHSEDSLSEPDIALLEKYGLDVWLAREQRRILSQGTEERWIASWQDYRLSVRRPAPSIVTPANIGRDFRVSDPPAKGRALIGVWHGALLVEAGNPDANSHELKILFSERNAFSMTMAAPLAGRLLDGTPIRGTYDQKGATLLLESDDMGEDGRFAFWFEGANLVLQQWNSRWTLVREPE